MTQGQGTARAAAAQHPRAGQDLLLTATWRRRWISWKPRTILRQALQKNYPSCAWLPACNVLRGTSEDMSLLIFVTIGCLVLLTTEAPIIMPIGAEVYSDVFT